MTRTRVLLLGGTAEARALAQVLVAAEIDVVSSLAGRVSRPRLPVGEVRIGGFGGVEGLVRAVGAEGFTHLVDATHPFAAGMRQHAVEAADVTGVPLLRLARPGWREHPDAGRWHWVADYPEAAARASELGSRPFLTSGRQTLPHFLGWTDRDVLVRVVEPLDIEVPPRWSVVEDRGPFSVADETALLSSRGIDVLVTKDSGGSYTAAKLDAARDLGVEVVVVQRPENPAGLAEVATPDEVLTWLGSRPPQ